MQTQRNEFVVLLHGLWMPAVVMLPLAWHLDSGGFRTRLFGYASMRAGLLENAERLARFVAAMNAEKLHLVGHSLGGLVILCMLEREPALPPGRVVLMGPPYRDSYAGRVLAGHSIGTRLLGRSMHEWLELPKLASVPAREIGVIAGSLSIGLGRVVADGLPEPNDGVVTVAETELAAACDRIVLPVSHSMMLLSHHVARQTAVFLRDGKFDHSAGN
jgi:pimeloyl-ACP methyl ester carboxylesterase